MLGVNDPHPLMGPEAWVRCFRRSLQYKWAVLPTNVPWNDAMKRLKSVTGPLYRYTGADAGKTYSRRAMVFAEADAIVADPGSVPLHNVLLPTVLFEGGKETMSLPGGWEMVPWDFEKYFKGQALKDGRRDITKEYTRAFIEVGKGELVMRSWVPGCAVQDIVRWLDQMAPESDLSPKKQGERSKWFWRSFKMTRGEMQAELTAALLMSAGEKT